jgi:hypothetical protein
LQFPVVEKREIVVYFQNKKVYEGKEKDIVLKI